MFGPGENHACNGRALHFAWFQVAGLRELYLTSSLLRRPSGGEERKGHRALTGCLLVSSFGDESTPLFLFWAPESLFCKQAIPSLIALPQIGFLDVHDTQVTATSGSGYHFLWHPLHKASLAFFPPGVLDPHTQRAVGSSQQKRNIKWVGEAEGTAEDL